MEHALIVASKGAELLEELLAAQYPDIRFTRAGAGSQARRRLVEGDGDCDLVVINTPLPDENGVELSVEAASGSRTGVILLVKSEFADEIGEKVEDYGVFVVEKPLNKAFFYRALKLVYASTRRVRGVEGEKRKLQQKMEELRLVDRAKCVLIQYLNLTEPQAHRYIEKQAMDLRSTRGEVARNILKTYES